MDIIFEQLLSISAKFSVFLDETIGWANSWQAHSRCPTLAAVRKALKDSA